MHHAPPWQEKVHITSVNDHTPCTLLQISSVSWLIGHWGWTWWMIQQISSSSPFCRRPLWAVLAWAGMSTLWNCPSSISSADHGVVHTPRCPEEWFWRGCCGRWCAQSVWVSVSQHFTLQQIHHHRRFWRNKSSSSFCQSECQNEHSSWKPWKVDAISLHKLKHSNRVLDWWISNGAGSMMIRDISCNQMKQIPFPSLLKSRGVWGCLLPGSFSQSEHQN